MSLLHLRNPLRRIHGLGSAVVVAAIWKSALLLIKGILLAENVKVQDVRPMANMNVVFVRVLVKNGNG